MSSAPDRIKLAIVVILATVLALSFGDALIKLFSSELVLWQIFVLRSLMVVPVLLAVRKFRFADVPVVPSALGWTIIRSVLLVLMWISYYAALPHLELSVAAVGFYTLPIFITLFSAAFVREAVSAKGWGGVALGFVGIILILRPTLVGFNVYAIFPLLSAMLYAIAMILTRTKCRNENPIILSLALNVSFIVAGLIAFVAGFSLGFPAADHGFPRNRCRGHRARSNRVHQGFRHTRRHT